MPAPSFRCCVLNELFIGRADGADLDASDARDSMWDAMPSPNRSPRRGHPSSASGTPPRSPNPRGRVGSTAGDGNTSSDGPTDAASSSRPRVDTKSPVTRATLAYTPVADLVASPLAPLAFDLKKLASQAPTRNKDTAIVALSNQLDAMRARLREAEEAAGSPAPVSSSVSRRGTDTAAGNTYRATPPASPPRHGARPATPPRAPSSPTRRLSGILTRNADALVTRGGGGMSNQSDLVVSSNTTSSASSWTDRAHNVALLSLEAESREWKDRLETAERREREAREDTKVAVEKARAAVLQECAIDSRQLEVLKYRALARGTTKLLERKARLAFSAFRKCVRDASHARRVERELVPKWNRKVVKRLAFTWFRGAVYRERNTRIAGERLALRVVLGNARRVTRAWFGVTKGEGQRRRRAARFKATLQMRVSKRLTRTSFAHWQTFAHTRAVVKRKVMRLYTRNIQRRHLSIPFTAWRQETRRESQAEELAAEMNALAASVRVFRFAGRRVFRKKCAIIEAWHSVSKQRKELRVAVARARGRWRDARGKLIIKAWRSVKKAARLGNFFSQKRAFDVWSASAKNTQFANLVVVRGTRRHLLQIKVNAFVHWARAVAPTQVAAAEKRVAAAEAAAAQALNLVEKCKREQMSDREALVASNIRREEALSALASAELRAAALAPNGGGVLETPLGWRALAPKNAEEVAEIVTSPGGTGKQSGKSRGGEDFGKGKDSAAVTHMSVLMDPCPPVFIPDRDPYALDAAEDGSPSTSGTAVTLLPGGDVVSFAALVVETPGFETLKGETLNLKTLNPQWNIDPDASWCTASSSTVKGSPPAGRENPGVCAVPAATAAVAAAAAGSDPAGVVGGVFLYGGFDSDQNTEMNDAYMLLRRLTDPDEIKTTRPDWEWIACAPDGNSVTPPARSHACVFATPPPFSGSKAEFDSYSTGDGPPTDIFLLGGYRSGASSGGLRNDLWRLDTATLTWSSTDHSGDVPSPRRDAAFCVTSVSASGAGKVFLHGGCAADGEPLADLYGLDISTLHWTRLPPGDEILASDPRDANKRGVNAEPEYGVAAEIAQVLAAKADADEANGGLSRPRTSYPSARSRHAITVIGSSLVVHGGRSPAVGEQSRFAKYVNDGAVYVLCLETMSWRVPRVVTSPEFPSPPTNRSVGHLLFPHPSGVVCVGGGANGGGVLASPPPVFLLELTAQRAGRKLRAESVSTSAKLVTTESSLRAATLQVTDAHSELTDMRTLAQRVKADADVLAAAEKSGREAQRSLLKKLKDSRDKIETAQVLVTAAREETALFRNRVDVAFAKEKQARRECDAAKSEIAEAELRAQRAETKALDATHEAQRREAQALAFVETKEQQDVLHTNHEIIRLALELENCKGFLSRAETSRAEAVEELRGASRKAAAGAEALAQAKDRAHLAEQSRANVLRDAQVARQTLRLEIEALEEQAAKATAERWAREADDAAAGVPPARGVNEDEESGSEESVDEELAEWSGSSDAEDTVEGDLPGRLVQMLNVENLGR